MSNSFVGRYEAHTDGLEALSIGLCSGCPDCADEYGLDQSEFDSGLESGEIPDEPSFSWSACDLCGSHLGGDRYPYHWIDPNGDLCHGFGACVDCLVYWANGNIPETDNA